MKMTRTISQFKGSMALALAGALAVLSIGTASAQVTTPVTAAEQTQPTKVQERILSRELTDADHKQSAQQGTALGQNTLTGAEQNTLQQEEGGPKGAGCTRVGGKCVDNEEMMGRGYDQSRVDKAQAVDGKMSSLKTYHDEEVKRTTADDGAEGAAYKTTEDSADAKIKGRREVADTDWEMTRRSLAEGRAGNAQGMGFPTCTTSTTVQPGTNPDAYIKEQHVCEIVQQPGDASGVICQRERIPTPNQETVEGTTEAYLGAPGGVNETFCRRETSLEGYQVVNPFSKSGELDISTEVGGLSCTRTVWPTQNTSNVAASASATLGVDLQSLGNLCKREVWPANSTATVGGSKTVSIGVNTETGGTSCTRTVWPTSSSSTTAVSHDATLSIDTQSNGNLCTREVWPTNGSTNTYGEQNAVLSIDNQQGGLSCTRYRWVEGGTATTPGFKDFQGYSQGPSYGGSTQAIQFAPAGVTISTPSISVTGFTGGSTACITVNGATKQASPENTYVVSFYNIGFGGCYAGTISFRASFNATSATKTFSVRESGNCSDTGTANCPTQWSCITSAQTTINGITVTTGDVSGLPLLYPGASNICTTGNLNRVCGGTATNSNSISIAGSVPAGTTSISGFTYVVNNPQSGVAVQLTQTPSASNNWVAIFNVNRTDFSTTKQSPNIKMSWNATSSTVNVSTKDTGNCGGGGTANCPAQWSCTAVAPTTINGINVTAAMAAQVAPLYSGASSSCARASLNKVCAGTASTTTTVNLSSRMPAGTTSISNLGFTVLNPQSGVTVTLTSAPTSANGWVATFRVDRTVWSSQPAQPNIRITWNSTYPTTNVTVKDTGDCTDPGSASCPTNWTCSNGAPYTVNGISVDAGMAASQAPLYPGASSSCVVARLARVCSGSTNQTTSVSIASELPAGTTTISNFNFVVNNPQSGVAVTLVQTPSSSNSWVAIFNVARSNWATTPAQPNLTLTWDATYPTVTTTLKDTGNCSSTGTANCPAQWSCQTQAPTVINGITVTTAMAGQYAPMYPGAPSTCARGSLDKACSGVAGVTTSVNLSSRMPAGTTSISNFAFTVTNPQTGVTVVLTQTPSAANGWVAIFRVDRSVWTSTPASPNVTMTWNSTVQSTSVTVQDSGNCADPGTASCPTSWSCANSAPYTVNSIVVDAGMAASQAPLYPGAANSCVVAKLSRVCGGVADTVTTISIADQIAAGTQAINDFAFTVTNPDPGITVTLVSAPTIDNGWVATFSVARDMSSGTVPPKPMVTMTWTTTTTEYRSNIVETGDCSPRTAFVAPPPSEPSFMEKAANLALDLVISKAYAAIAICNDPEQAGCDGSGGGGQLPPGETPPDDEPPPITGPGDACSIKWTCARSYPGQIDGIDVTQAMLDARGPLFDGDGPPPACLEATYERACSDGGASGTTEISIAEFLQPGTQEISNYNWTLIEPGAGVSVESVQVPALANNWIAKFTVTRTDFSVAPVSPKVKLTWNMPGEVTYEFPVTETGDCSQGVEDEFCTTEWSCDDQAPEPTRPLKVCEHITTPWYNGAPATSTTSPAEKSFNLQSFIKANTVQISHFKYAVQTNVGGCDIGVSPFPPTSTAMQVTEVTRNTSTTECKPLIRFEWDNLCPDESWTAPSPPSGGWGPSRPGNRINYNQQLASLNPTQKFLALVEKVGNALLPSAMAAVCATCEYEGGGGYWDGGDIADEPPLFPGDGPPATCMKATKKQNCSGTWTGTECTINSEGEEVCVTVDPDTPPNNDCPALEEDPECEMIREECTDGAMSSSGWCYVKSRLYECKRKVPGGGATDPIITETRTCTGESSAGVTLPPVCQDGSCTNEQTQTNSVGMSKAGAKMMLLQTVMNDTNQVPGSGSGTGGGSSPTEPTGPVNQVQATPKASIGDMLLGMAGIGTAYAQTAPTTPTDPFQIPDWVQGTDEDPTDGTGGLDSGTLSGMNIRFFTGKKRDCMKALGGLLNCCKKTPPQDQSPTLWSYIKKNLTQANNAKGREMEAANDPSGFLSMMQGASQDDLMKMFTSNLDSLKGGGNGGDTNTDATFQKAYNDFFKHETTVVKPKLAWYCDNDEFELAVGKQTGTCTHLGSFCQTKVLGHCIIKKDRYCCFNSPMTRIIREHLDQTGVADLGTAKRPNCGGLTIEQVSRMNLDNINTNELEGRMAQGMFNINIADLQNMSFADIQSMFDGAQSLIGDPTRMNPSDRSQSYVDQTDPNGAYSSILGSQSGYRPEATQTEATAGTIGLNTLERDVSRGVALTINVVRTGSKGAVSVRVWTEDGTAIAGTHYTSFSTQVGFMDGESGSKPVLLKTTKIDTAVPRQNLKVKIEITAGDATLSGNSEATLWLKEQN